MTRLAFFDSIPPLVLRDPLAECLGVLRHGETFRYTFEDAVKLCGHSCPTVARAWQATAAALEALYPNEVPERGQVEVIVGGAPDSGASGPAALVIGLITGAAPETGFGGLGGRFGRRNLLRFDADLDGTLRFHRRDTGVTVEVVEPAPIPVPAELPKLAAAVMTGRATAIDQQRFGELWQANVAQILAAGLPRVVAV